MLYALKETIEFCQNFKDNEFYKLINIENLTEKLEIEIEDKIKNDLTKILKDLHFFQNNLKIHNKD
jgi:hypothetical protein